ncbi:MAG: sel1 repeat family protein [Xanthomonadaceae bacterium]|nr:sel1 repeat family protein [Xanthomonadaceae bacterium]
MRRSSVLLAAAGLLLAAAACVWLAGVRTAPAPAAASPAAPAPAAPSVPPVAAAASASASASNLSADRRADLDRRVAAGDVDAMAELGGIIGVCRHYSPISAQHIEETVVDGMAAGVEPPLIAGKPVSPELLVLMLQQGQPELDRRCAGIDRRQLRDDLDRAPALLERAADAGSVEAMLDYSRYAFAGYGGTDQMLADADEVARRKEKARAYLRESLRRGDARALLLLGDAYASGPLEKIDPLQAYAYASAFFQSPAGQEWSPRLRELYLQALAQQLDAQQLIQARENAAQISRDFQAGTAPR